MIILVIQLTPGSIADGSGDRVGRMAGDKGVVDTLPRMEEATDPAPLT